MRTSEWLTHYFIALMLGVVLVLLILWAAETLGWIEISLMRDVAPRGRFWPVV